MAITSTDGQLKSGDKIGLLYRAPVDPKDEQAVADSQTQLNAAAQALQNVELTIAEHMAVPDKFSTLEILLAETNVRLLESGLTEREQAESKAVRDALPDTTQNLFTEIEDFFIKTAERFKEADITAVLAATEWQDTRRAMRAAEQVGWYPRWIINDSQPALTVLAGAPEQQKRNLVQVSAQRAAADEIPELDQRCISLRNTAVAAPTFSHRQHTDAWNALTTLCDYLDVVFAAITRIDGKVTSENFLDALRETDYQTPSGPVIRFTATDDYGNDRFRVLEADPDCLLNSWGCMRAITEWAEPFNASAAAAAGAS